MKGMREIPPGYEQDPNGSYSKKLRPKNLDAGSKVGPSSSRADATVVTESPRVGFEIQPSTDEAKLNKTEKAYLAILRSRHSDVRIQAITLKLGNDTRYTPDFSTIVGGNYVFFEVKGGFVREDGWIKLKIAARTYREFRFVLAQYKGKIWKEEAVNP